MGRFAMTSTRDTSRNRAGLLGLVDRLCADRGGGIALTFAVGAPLLFGSVGMAVDFGVLYAQKIGAQTAADAAAASGALERARGAVDTLEQVARLDAARNGYEHGVEATLVEINSPPTRGAHVGNPSAVEAIVQRRLEPLFVRVLGVEQFTVGARSVAAAVADPDSRACVLALNREADAAIGNKGNAVIDLTNCTVASNSTSQASIAITGSTQLTAGSLWTAGDYVIDGSAIVALARPGVTRGWRIEDPYARLQMPSQIVCDRNNTVINGGYVELPPGVYCGGITVGSTAVVTFAPGLYVLDRGDLVVHAQAEVRCNCGPEEGVTILLTSSGAAAQIGTVTINGGGGIDLRAPTATGAAYRGVLIAQDRRSTSKRGAKFNGGSTMRLTGAIYFPAEALEWSGNDGTSAPNCTEIVADSVSFAGAARLENSACPAMGLKPLTVSGVRIIE